MPIYENTQDNFSPPSPVLKVAISSPNSNQIRHYNAIVDTGAPISAVPEDIIKQLGNLQYSPLRFKSPVSKEAIITKNIYRVRIKMENVGEQEVEVLAIPRSYGIIGRDILNKHKIILDGPNQVWSIE